MTNKCETCGGRGTILESHYPESRTVDEWPCPDCDSGMIKARNEEQRTKKRLAAADKLAEAAKVIDDIIHLDITEREAAMWRSLSDALEGYELAKGPNND